MGQSKDSAYEYRFAIVEFYEECQEKDELLPIDLVPGSWVKNRKGTYLCKYPSKENFEYVEKWTKEEKDPEHNWKLYPVIPIHGADDFAQGKRRLMRAFETRNCASTDCERQESAGKLEIASQSNLRRILHTKLPMGEPLNEDKVYSNSGNESSSDIKAYEISCSSSIDGKKKRSNQTRYVPPQQSDSDNEHSVIHSQSKKIVNVKKNSTKSKSTTKGSNANKLHPDDSEAGKRTGRNHGKLLVESSDGDSENYLNLEENDTPTKRSTKTPASDNSSARNKLKLDGTGARKRIGQNREKSSVDSSNGDRESNSNLEENDRSTKRPTESSGPDNSSKKNKLKLDATEAAKRIGQNGEKSSVESSDGDCENNSNFEENDSPTKRPTKSSAPDNSSKRNKLKLDGTGAGKRIGQNREKSSVESSDGDRENNSNLEENDTPTKHPTKSSAPDNSSKRNKLKLDGAGAGKRIGQNRGCLPVESTDSDSELYPNFDENNASKKRPTKSLQPDNNKSKLDDALVEFMNEKFKALEVSIHRKIKGSKESILYNIEHKMEELKLAVVASSKVPHGSVKELMAAVKTSLPISNLDDFLAFDRSVNEEQEKKDALIALFHFLCFEPPTSQKCIERALPMIFKKSVQGQYSGQGRKSKGVGKLDFSATATFACFEVAVKAKFGDSEETKGLKSKVGTWLSHFGDREKGRQVRA